MSLQAKLCKQRTKNIKFSHVFNVKNHCAMRSNKGLKQKFTFFLLLTKASLLHILHLIVFLLELTEVRQVLLHNSLTVPESSTGARIML